MKMINDRKMWSQPTITSVERLKECPPAGTHSSIAKGTSLTEYLYDGSRQLSTGTPN